MLPEEDEVPQSDHSVELAADLESPFPTRRRRIAQFAAVAVLLGACGLIALAFSEHQRAIETERALESAQSAQLQDGWKTLGALAAQEARATDAENAAPQPPAAPTVPPAPATTNIVIVNPPARPQRNSSNVEAPVVPNVVAPTPSVGTPASNGSNTVYVPTPALPNITTGADIPGQNLSNGSVPGSLPNPALTNGSSGGIPATPTEPNGATSAAPNAPSAPNTPPTPVGTIPVSPPPSGITP
jgi:hypothetical protein